VNNDDDVLLLPPLKFYSTSTVTILLLTATAAIMKVSATSVLNGVIGDYLVSTNNELATPMLLLRRPGQPVECTKLVQELKAKSENAHICILIHGLVSDEHAWTFTHEDHQVDYGSLLERHHCDTTCLYLRYNTGLHISTNGNRLCEILQALVTQISASSPNIQITLLCHSMGGLVARSATQYALRSDASTDNDNWIRATKRIIFLGTPHQGSYWECAGNILTCALDHVPITKGAAKLAKLRSHGIQDLRYGYTLEEDWNATTSTTDQQEQQDASTWSAWMQNTKQPHQEQLLEWVQYHAVTGTIMSDPQHPISLLLGDGLVSKASAEGRSAQPGYTLNFTSTREFPGIHHNRLQCCWEVYVQVKEWMANDTTTTTAVESVPADEYWTSLPCRATTSCVLYNDKNEPECTDSGFVLLETDNVNDADARSITMMDTMTCSHGAKCPVCPTKLGSFARARGATALVQGAVDAGVTAVEQVQTQVTDNVYNAIVYCTPPVVAPLVQGVHGIHIGIVSSIYLSVRRVNYGVGETVKFGFRAMDSIESISFRMSRYLGYCDRR
jgi:triacylglycerol lipase